MKILVIMYIGFYLVAAKKNNQQSWCNCGLMNKRVINGTEVPKDGHPWTAALMLRSSFSYLFFCGGSIITSRHVLTAAHCLKGKQGSNVWIAAGQHKLIKKGKEQMFQSKQFIIHKKYDSEKLIYDIGLVVTSNEIEYSLRVIPVCLPKTKLKLEDLGAKVTVAGWGWTSTIAGSASDVLQQVEIDVVPMWVCEKSYTGITFINQLCTYTEGKSAFNGDSGGPLIWKNPENDEQIQVGLVSYGDLGATRPSVETDVSAYLGIRPLQSLCTGH